MQIVDYGYKIAQLQDKDFWDTYNFSITRTSTHNHDGENSALLGPGHLEPLKVFIDTIDWPAPVDEVYTSDSIPLPPNVTWPDQGVFPLIATGTSTDNKKVEVDYIRVDDFNFAVRQHTNQALILALS